MRTTIYIQEHARRLRFQKASATDSRGRTAPRRSDQRLGTSPGLLSWLAGNLTPILTLRRMCCLGAPIALLWRFRELPEDLASYGPLPRLLCAAASLLFSCSVVALLLCVVAFSSLLPFCCNHLTLCPFLWSLPPSFYL